MILATRCSACGTTFRVVQDQLKVREGWVRCGRCGEVFDALASLFELEREASQSLPEPIEPAGASVPASHAPMQAQAERDLDELAGAAVDAELHAVDSNDEVAGAAVDLRDDAVRAIVDSADDAVVAPGEATAGVAASREEPAAAEPSTDAAVEAPSPIDEAPGALTSRVDDSPTPQEPEAPEATEPTPEFLRHAEPATRWHTPRMRLVLAAAAAGLAVALALQLAHHFRDSIAARWPAFAPLLGAWCELTHCRIEAPRRIVDVTVESSALTPAAPGSEALRLAVTLRNRGSLPVLMPSLDLSITDSNGDVVARRAIEPADFHVSDTALAPGSEVPLQVLLAAGGGRVAGYTVEIFYP